MNVTTPSLRNQRRPLKAVRELVHRLTGIHLTVQKDLLVASRLGKRMKTLGLESIDQYLACVQAPDNRGELQHMLDALTTNKTSFFREPAHFQFLGRNLLRDVQTSRQQSLRIWCAGCSSGEEPLTIAMVLREHLPHIDSMDVRILATDLSTRMLERARKSSYGDTAISDIPPRLLRTYFETVRAGQSTSYAAAPALRRLIRWARLNLMDPWPMKGPFDAIFCRNVMIYFDRATQESLVERFRRILRPGGHLFVGHSESFTATSETFRYVQPAVYRKEDA